jgi:F-type H+-transporting ATPase subunit a
VEQLILAEGCDVAEVTMCAPAEVSELFEFAAPWPELAAWFTRTQMLILLIPVIVIGLFWLALRKPKLVPGKLQMVVESIYNMVHDGIAKDVIGPGGEKYVPYLLSVFMFVLIGNVYEITPFVNFPVTSRIALPAFLAIFTYIIFLVAGVRKQGLGYFGHLIWPPGVPIALRPLVGLIETASTLVVRPVSLAIRLFANLVAGHVMLSLLLGTAGTFIWAWLTNPEIGFGKGAVGMAWFVMGLGIFLFEMLVTFLQAYIFTLLSAVYIQTSLHPEH